MQRPPEGKTIAILVQTVSIEYGPLEVGDITAAVRKLRLGRAGGPSDMKTEHHKAWLREATREKEWDTETWYKVVSVIQV